MRPLGRLHVAFDLFMQQNPYLNIHKRRSKAKINTKLGFKSWIVFPRFAPVLYLISHTKPYAFLAIIFAPVFSYSKVINLRVSSNLFE